MKILNQLINLLWTALAFGPVVLHWYRYPEIHFVVAGTIISLAFILIPLHFFRVSRYRRWYERLGVPFAGMLVQNGALVNRLKRSRNKAFRGLTRNNLHQFISSSVMYERFHLSAFCFFLLTATHAVIRLRYQAAGWIMLANIFYNIYPVLLQQYYRLRIELLACSKG